MEEISLKDFLGKYYSTEKQKSALRGRSSDFLNSYFWSDKEETAENELNVNKEFGDLEYAETDDFFLYVCGMRNLYGEGLESFQFER